MSAFNPRGVIGVIGVILALIALYLLLEKGANTTQLLGSIAQGAIGLTGTLQGRTVSYAGVSVGQPV